MRKDFEKLFIHLESPEKLLGNILRRIDKEKRLAAVKRRLAVFSFALFAAGAAMIPAFRMLQAGLSETGFMEFFSLIFLDSGAVFAYRQSFAFALLETLPTTGIIAFLGAVFVFLQSLKFLARDTKVVFSPLNNR